jgi:hypothetical protein
MNRLTGRNRLTDPQYWKWIFGAYALFMVAAALITLVLALIMLDPVMSIIVCIVSGIIIASLYPAGLRHFVVRGAH